MENQAKFSFGILPPPATLKAAFMCWILANHMPFNVLEGKEFQDLCLMANFDVVPLGRKCAADAGLDTLFNECRDLIGK